MVHSGFYSALKSVLPRCLAVIDMLTSTEDSKKGSWTVYVTGHSLGGALATLMSWEIEAIRERDLPAVGRVVMYNFGEDVYFKLSVTISTMTMLTVTMMAKVQFLMRECRW